MPQLPKEYKLPKGQTLWRETNKGSETFRLPKEVTYEEKKYKVLSDHNKHESKLLLCEALRFASLNTIGVKNEKVISTSQFNQSTSQNTERQIWLCHKDVEQISQKIGE